MTTQNFKLYDIVTPKQSEGIYGDYHRGEMYVVLGFLDDGYVQLSDKYRPGRCQVKHAGYFELYDPHDFIKPLEREWWMHWQPWLYGFVLCFIIFTLFGAVVSK